MRPNYVLATITAGWYVEGELGSAKMYPDEMTPQEIAADMWRSRRSECESKLFLVNRTLAEMGHNDLRDTEHGRVLVSMAVLYEVGPGDTACQIIDDLVGPSEMAA